MPTPPVVKNLIIACVAVFLVQSFSDAFRFPTAGLIEVWGSLIPQAVWAQGQAWRLVTYMFLHGGFMHLFFNMLTLWMFGGPVVAQIGERRFLGLYFTSGVIAGLLSALFYFAGLAGGPHVFIIGASGALLGVMFAFAKFFPNVPILVLGIFPVPAKYMVWGTGAISLLLGVTGEGNVAHLTHLFGILGGWAYLRLSEPVVRVIERAATAHETNKARKAVEELQTREEFFDSRVDPILRKISRNGMDSLTAQERDILQKASSMKRPANTVDLRAWRRDRDG
ncbi:MAG TPA: rhomboid family intramembrane serine protease [Fibrobacteria bacterium]|nr:rhomboid family intramembrane serine protease [Fibrobacteria bacterium]HOX51306.1 rhomboid family intramembrane serine protease [Fibrobacteria bacterium]